MDTHYTNEQNIAFPLAVFLMADNYDYDDRTNAISATTLLKPIKQIVLARIHRDLLKRVDISSLIASKLGTAIHDSCERAWLDKDNVARALALCGMAPEWLSKVVINPTDPAPDSFPIYIEQRHSKDVDGYVVTGKYDLVVNGGLSDYKSTSVWSYIYGSNIDKYILQGSIYKWLAPEIITNDNMHIHYIFTDWSAVKAKQDPKYPSMRLLTESYPLMDIETTDTWIKSKLAQIKQYEENHSLVIPDCTEEELWATKAQYKYYKNPNKLARSTKNFDSMADAMSRNLADGGIGKIVEIPGEVKACRWCPVINICDQAKELLRTDRLHL